MDNLTKFYNEEIFLQRLEQEIVRSKRYNRTLGVLLLKVDPAAGVAKNYSHYPVLKKCSTIIKKLAREIDIPGRITDKLGLVLLEATPEGALIMASRILKGVNGLRFLEEDHDFRISAAVGIANYPTDGQTAADLLKSAESALQNKPLKA